MPGVDVVIPSYQYGRFLRDCITSVLTQAGADVRVLIIDNASTDNSLEVAGRLAAEDGRVEVLARQTNLGAAASWNEGIDWASADYFLVLCADDRLAPGSLARAVAALERHKEVSFCHGKAVSVFPGDPLPRLDRGDLQGAWRLWSGPAFIRHFCRTAVNHISGCTAVVRTAMQKQAGYYRPELPHTDDFEMWMRLATLGPVAETTAVQGISLIHGANMSAHYHAVQTRDLLAGEAAFESFFAHEGAALPGADRMLRQARRSLGERAYWSALSHLCRGHSGTSVGLIRLAFRLCPTTKVVPPVSYLLRMDRPFNRIAEVISEAAGWNRKARNT